MVVVRAVCVRVRSEHGVDRPLNGVVFTRQFHRRRQRGLIGEGLHAGMFVIDAAKIERDARHAEQHYRENDDLNHHRRGTALVKTLERAAKHNASPCYTTPRM